MQKIKLILIFSLSLLYGQRTAFYDSRGVNGFYHVPQEHSLKLGVMVGRHALFTAFRVNYAYLVKSYVSVGVDVLGEFTKIDEANYNFVGVGFISPFTVFAYARFAMHAGLGLYGGYEEMYFARFKEIAPVYSKNGIYGLGAYADVEVYATQFLAFFIAGNYLAFFNSNIGIFRPYGQVGVKFKLR